MPRYDDACGPNCHGITRRRHCSYGDPCGGTDCSTCYGDGVDHSGCDTPDDCAESAYGDDNQDADA